MEKSHLINLHIILCEDRNGTIWLVLTVLSPYDAKGDSLEYFNLKTKEGIPLQYDYFY